MTELQQTKGSFKMIGKVTRIDKDGAYKEEQAQKGKKQGETYRSLRFGVQTSKTNTMTVQMYDFEPENVFLWNSDKKKADSSYKGDKVPFGQWEAQEEMYREQGYAVLQTRVGLTYGEDGKLQSKGLPSFVASQEIYNELDNGDSVAIEGKIRFSKYTNREGKEVPQTTFTIERVFRLKDDVDFDKADFEEITYFEQELVFVDLDIDKAEGVAYLTGRTIEYNKSFNDSQFVIRFKDENGKADDDMVKLVQAIKDRVKFGDILKVRGDAVNRVIINEVEGEEETDKDDPFAVFGGKQKPKHAQTYTARTYLSEMQINGVDGHDEGVYTEEDFVVEELIDKGNTSDAFGGKPKKANPFDLGEGEPEISDDDLPF